MTAVPADGTGSALYEGVVTHMRHKPKKHGLRYRVFSLLIDLDEMEALSRRLRFLSLERFNLFSLYRGDYGTGGDRSLKDQITGLLRQNDIDLEGGRIHMLAYPRMLGYVFNPLCVYFCHDRAHRLAAILYEVHNTFGERHNYLFRVDGDRDGDTIAAHTADTCFYVSPFQSVDGRYVFKLALPGEKLALSIRAEDASGGHLTAAFTARRRPLTDKTLLGLAIKLPLMTLKVIAGIHWHAFRLWLKGLKIYRHGDRHDHGTSMACPVKTDTTEMIGEQNS